jgi:hypothetical protein
MIPHVTSAEFDIPAIRRKKRRKKKKKKKKRDISHVTFLFRVSFMILA